MIFQRITAIIALSSLLIISPIVNAKPTVGVVVSMVSEAQYLCSHNFNCKKSTTHNGLKFYKGEFANHPAILVITGVGLVNSSLGTAGLIDNYHPKVMIMIGSAGGINAATRGDVVIGAKVFDLEFGTYNPQTDQPTYPEVNVSDLLDPNNDQTQPLVLGTQTDPHLQSVANKTAAYFKDHPLPAEAAGRAIPTVKVGIIANSSVFYTPNSMTEEIKKAGVDVISFEDTGFLQTCWLLKAKCVAIRSVSNALPVNKSNPPIFAEYAGQNSAMVAEQYLKILLG